MAMHLDRIDDLLLLIDELDMRMWEINLTDVDESGKLNKSLSDLRVSHVKSLVDELLIIRCSLSNLCGDNSPTKSTVEEKRC